MREHEHHQMEVSQPSPAGLTTMVGFREGMATPLQAEAPDTMLPPNDVLVTPPTAVCAEGVAVGVAGTWRVAPHSGTPPA